MENVLVVWIAGTMILNGEFSVGMLFAFLAYKQQFISRTTGLIECAIDLKMLNLHTSRVADIALSEIEETATNPEDLSEKDSLDIKVNNVSFQYSDNENSVISDLNMHIIQGEFVALVGRSGCRKTTLIKLLLGLLTPDKGEILIGGNSLSKLDMAAF